MRYIYTKTLDKADDIQTDVRTGLEYDEAMSLFGAKVQSLLKICLNNRLLRGRVDIHDGRATVKIEDEVHIVTIEKEGV